MGETGSGDGPTGLWHRGRSRIGAAFVVCYALPCAAILIYAATCRTEWCGVVAVLPLLPWFIAVRAVSDSVFGFGAGMSVVTCLSVILNVLTLYGAGLGLSWLIRVARRSD